MTKRVAAFAIVILMRGLPSLAQITEYSNETVFKAALANPTVIDFDGLQNSSVLTGTEFQSQGVTITQVDGQRLNVLSSPPTDAYFGSLFGSLPNGISSSYASVPTPGYVQECCGVQFDNSNSDNIRFSLSSGASAAGIWVGENDVAGITVRFRDFNDNVIYTKYLPPLNPHSGFYGISSAIPIAAMEVSNSALDGDGVFFDDFMFQPSCVMSPPIISNAATSRTILWPPNHQLVTVGVSYSVTSSCQATSSCTLSARSNEPDDGLGDGDVADDITIVDPHTLVLRAERSGLGNGRRYNVQISCTDSDNNQAQQVLTVAIPKNMK